MKNLEKSKKTKKTKLQTLTHQLVPTWVLQFWFFVGFCRFFGFTLRNPKKTKKNKIARPMSVQAGELGSAILVFFVFFVFFGFTSRNKKKNKKKQKKQKKTKLQDLCRYKLVS